LYQRTATDIIALYQRTATDIKGAQYNYVLAHNCQKKIFFKKREKKL